MYERERDLIEGLELLLEHLSLSHTHVFSYSTVCVRERDLIEGLELLLEPRGLFGKLHLLCVLWFRS